jgi:carboxylate-amine ligase
VLLAGLTRALVATALAEARRDAPVPAAPMRRVDAGLAAAARHGIAGTGVDAFTGQTVAARNILAQLLDHVHAALEARGDAGVVTRLLSVLEDRGTGAERQRALFANAGSTPEFVEALARATLPEAEPASLQGRLAPFPRTNSAVA